MAARKNGEQTPTGRAPGNGMPDAASLATLRAWYEGLSAREAVVRYLGHARADGESSRRYIGAIRRQLERFADRRHQPDLAELFRCSPSQRSALARKVTRALDLLPTLPLPQPLIGDAVGEWLDSRAVRALEAEGIKTLSALTVRIPRRRRWWVAVPGLGVAGARRIEAFFAAHPELTARARELVVSSQVSSVTPWERLVVPADVDGTRGTFRAPAATCALSATNDYEAVQAWLAMHESPETGRAYRKEAERLMLWAILERGRALSSLTSEDAMAYRTFLRRPVPDARWVGPSRSRSSHEWRPFAGSLAPRSMSYALTVLGAMFRWLIQQRYLLANPFAGVKVRGGSRAIALTASRYFAKGEWSMIQTVAEGLEWSYGWGVDAAHRLRLIVDFAYATGLRNSELVNASLGDVEIDDEDRHWIHVIGKGGKAGKVALPPLAWTALIRYLAHRRLPTDPSRWKRSTRVIGDLSEDPGAGITSTRLWAIMKRFFALVADVVRERSPNTADKLIKASPHWMRHTHATHALAEGVELKTVRDNLRHASISTTSVYVHTDEVQRADQLARAFGAR